jgi:hypothetical protein
VEAEVIDSMDRRDRTMTGSEADRLKWLSQAALLAAIGVAIIAVTLGPLHRLFLRVPIDYNEGWNAYQTLAAMSGGILYPAVDSLISNNYPPLSYYIVGLVGKFIGDNVVAGRAIALLGLIAVAINIYGLVRRLGGEKFFATFSSLLFLLYIGTHVPGYVVQDDPQWLGHAFVTSGAVFFLRAQTIHRPFGSLMLSSLLCVAGVLVKVNLIILPLAIFAWSAFCNRRQLLAWTSMSVGVGLGLLLLATELYGVVFLRDVFEHQRVMSLHKLVADARFFMPLTPLAIYSGLLGAIGWRDPRVKFAVIYVCVGGSLGLFFLCGAGCDANVLFDLDIALCISAGLLASRLVPLLDVTLRRFSPTAMALVIASVCLPNIAQAYSYSIYLVKQDRQLRQGYLAFVAAMARTEGPAACEEPSLCYWAGKNFEIDFFNYDQKLKKGVVGPDLLRNRIDEGYYSTIQTIGPPADKLIGENISDHIRAHYAVTRQLGEQLLLAPRR